MEATPSSYTSFSQITQETQELLNQMQAKRKEGQYDNADCIEKLKAILNKIELANKHEQLPARLGGSLHSLINNAYYSVDLSKEKELIKVVSQHKSTASQRMMLTVFESLNDDIPSLRSCLKDSMLTASGALDILDIKLKNIKEEHLELVSGDEKAFFEKVVNMAKSKEKSETAMIVQFQMPMLISLCFTVTPIFLRKQKGKPLEILMTDCLGIGLNIKIFTNILQKLPIGANVYVLSLTRNVHGTNPAIFAASDIIHYCKLKKQGINLFEFAKQQSSPMVIEQMDMGLDKTQEILLKGLGFFLSNPKFFSFDILPAKMMKLTDSEEVVKQFLSSHPEMKAEVVDSKTGETLEENIERYSYGSPKYNYHSSIKFTRLVSHLALQALEKDENLRALIPEKFKEEKAKED